MQGNYREDFFTVALWSFQTFFLSHFNVNSLEQFTEEWCVYLCGTVLITHYHPMTWE